ncbi:MAG: hypothetical protein KDA16_03445 [Phycisphaerales bacterium]|nr:hypothetical protein [Phycisphaerales bacterium]
MPPKRIAIITCETLPEPDPDEPILLDALRAAGMEAHMLAWDAPPNSPKHGNPSDYDLCVIRSSWNYYHDPDAFLAWIDSCASRSTLLNPAPVVKWNIHKHYLRDLQRADLPIVPTEFVNRGESVSFIDIMRARNWTDAVIKPCVSAASFNTRRFSLDQSNAAQRFLDQLTYSADAMLQPYMRSVDTAGERSIMWIANHGNGGVTHAIRKNPRFAGQDESVSGSLPVTDTERALFDRTLAALPFSASDLLYARLDLMPDDTGAQRISELELIEPSLFLLQEPRALSALVDAIAARAA